MSIPDELARREEGLQKLAEAPKGAAGSRCRCDHTAEGVKREDDTDATQHEIHREHTAVGLTLAL